MSSLRKLRRKGAPVASTSAKLTKAEAYKQLVEALQSTGDKKSARALASVLEMARKRL